MWKCPKCGEERKSKGGHYRSCGNPWLWVEVFTAKVKRGADDECWPFMGARVPGAGYGRAWLGRKIDGDKLVAAHRIAYMLAYGNIPAGKDICHTCDNPPCCNPAHLWAGTETENMQDAKAKGRIYTPSPSKAKLNAENVKQILDLRGKVRAEDVATMFDLSIATVHLVWTGKRGAKFLQQVSQ